MKVYIRVYTNFTERFIQSVIKIKKNTFQGKCMALHHHH